MEDGVAAVALEAPDVPLAVEGDEGLALAQLLPAAGAGARVALGPGAPLAGAAAGAAHGRRRLPHRDAHAPVA